MAGRPLSRARRAMQALDRPARERVPPDVWRAWTEGERLEYLWARSQDDALELSNIPWSGATPAEQTAKLRVFEGFLRLGYVMRRDAQRDLSTHEREEIAAFLAERKAKREKL